MDDCMEYTELISAYIDGELSVQDKLRVEAHLNECESCSSLLDIYKSISIAVDDSLVAAPESISAAVMDRITSGSADKLKSYKRVNLILTRVLPAAACLAFLLLTVPYLFGIFGSNNNFGSNETTGALSSVIGAPSANMASGGSSSSSAESAPSSEYSMRQELVTTESTQDDSMDSDTDESEQLRGESAAPSPVSAPEPSAGPGVAPAPEESYPAPGSASLETQETPVEAEEEKADIPLLSPEPPADVVGGDPDFGENAIDEEYYPLAPLLESDDQIPDESIPVAMIVSDDADAEFLDGIYAIIMISGDLPSVLAEQYPADMTSGGEMYFEISRTAAIELIDEISGRGGVVIRIVDEDGTYATVYYTPGG